MMRSSPSPRRQRARSGRHCLFRLCLLLATSSLLLVFSEGSTLNNDAEDNHRVSNDVADDVGRLLKTTRMLPKEEDVITDQPTYNPTVTPDKKQPKPKKTDQPTYFPTSSPKPTNNPTISPPPTDNPTISFPPTGIDMPTKSPSDAPTRSRSPSLLPTTSPSISTNPTAIPSSLPTTSQEPTVFPSEVPSTTPSSEPTGLPSSSPTTSAMPSMAPIPYARSERINLRYTPWSQLTPETQSLAQQLDYDISTWDTLGINPIENLDWARLAREQKNAARQLGYDLFSWDCWQNHFQSYRWIDLGEPYIQVGQWWEELGWDIYSWNRQNDPPASDVLTWYELSDGERSAAANLCYFRTSWDEEVVLAGGYPIAQPEFRYGHWMTLSEDVREMADERLKYSALSWNVLGLANVESREWESLTEYEREAAVGMGFTQLSWDCWLNHFRSYTWDDLEFFGLDLSYLALGWTELSWDGIETPPPSKDTSWKDLTEEERLAATELCFFRDNWDGLDMTPNNGPFLYPKVKARYIEWRALSPDVKRPARDSLLYNRTNWNNLGTSEIESRSWDELTEHQKSDAMSIGFYQRTWDCFHNHYRSYQWDALDRDSRDALQVLGWSETSWKENDTPPSYANEWDRLSEAEQSKASILCFFEDNWNGNSLVTLDEVITDDGEAVGDTGSVTEGGSTGSGTEGGSTGSGSEGGSTGSGSEGGSTGTDPDAQTPTGQGPDVNSVSEVLNPTDPANSAADMSRTRSMMCIISVIFGTLIQLSQ